MCRRDGNYVCRADGRGVVCDVTAGTPTSMRELCDAAFADEDCDGKSNDGCECIDGLSADRPCARRPGFCDPGVQRCQEGRWTDCQQARAGTAETCNGVDDSCDGAVDEGFAVGKACVVEDANGCRRYGTTVCAPGGVDVICDAQIADVRSETCNGADDDCNGVIDDLQGPCGFDGTAGSPCRRGTRACQNGREVCLGGVGPSEEVCNGVDDDCDGLKDEVFDVGKTCEAGVGPCHVSGERVCAPDGHGTVCSVQPLPPTPETCNGVDDDCDGVPDYTVSGGAIVSACACSRQPLTPSQGMRDTFENSASPSMCTVSASGGTMQFSTGACASPFPFAQCIFSSVDMTAFDADHDGLAVLEISFSLATTLFSEVNFYYGQYPRRKKLRPFSGSQVQAGIGPGCFRVFFAPSDAICPVFSQGDLASQALVDFPAVCATGCSNGKWSASSPLCAFSYAATVLYVTVEGCRAGAESGTIEDIVVRQHGTGTGPNCTCAPGRGCKDLTKPICDPRAALPDPACPPGTRCGGVCLTEAEQTAICAFDTAESN